MLTSAERRYSTNEKECLAVLFGCKKSRSYLEHKEFELQCDNLALHWLLRRVKDVGQLGWWIIHLAPFKFRVKHTCGADNHVADALSRMYTEEATKDVKGICGALLESLLLVYSSLEDHQKEDGFCKKIQEEIQEKRGSAEGFQVHRGLLCYYPQKG